MIRVPTETLEKAGKWLFWKATRKVIPRTSTAIAEGKLFSSWCWVFITGNQQNRKAWCQNTSTAVTQQPVNHTLRKLRGDQPKIPPLMHFLWMGTASTVQQLKSRPREEDFPLQRTSQLQGRNLRESRGKPIVSFHKLYFHLALFPSPSVLPASNNQGHFTRPSQPCPDCVLSC